MNKIIDVALDKLAVEVDQDFGAQTAIDRMSMVCLHCGLIGLLEHCPRCSDRAGENWVLRVYAYPAELAAYRLGGQAAVLQILLADV